VTLIPTPDDEERRRMQERPGEELRLALAVVLGLALVAIGLRLFAPEVRPSFQGGVTQGADP
jgi:hypothetical protein